MVPTPVKQRRRVDFCSPRSNPRRTVLTGLYNRSTDDFLGPFGHDSTEWPSYDDLGPYGRNAEAVSGARAYNGLG